MLIMFSSFSLSRLCLSVSEVMQTVLFVKYLVVNFEFQDVFFRKVVFFFWFSQNQQHQIVVIILYALVLTLLSCQSCTQPNILKALGQTLLTNKICTSQKIKNKNKLLPEIRIWCSVSFLEFEVSFLIFFVNIREILQRNIFQSTAEVEIFFLASILTRQLLDYSVLLNDAIEKI